MFPASAAPLGQMPPPSLAVISQGLPSQATLGSIPSRSVYSTIALPALQNQRGGQGVPQQAATEAPAGVAPHAAAFSLAQLASPGSSPDRSVAFFAQLLAQSEPEAQAELTRSFPGTVPLRPGHPELLTRFANVKYMPSNAFKPLTPPPRAEYQPPAPAPSSAPLPARTAATTTPQLQTQTTQHAYNTAAVLRQGVTYAPVTLSRTIRSGAPAEAFPRTSTRAPGDKQALSAYARTSARAVESATGTEDA